MMKRKEKKRDEKKIESNTHFNTTLPLLHMKQCLHTIDKFRFVTVFILKLICAKKYENEALFDHGSCD